MNKTPLLATLIFIYLTRCADINCYSDSKSVYLQQNTSGTIGCCSFPSSNAVKRFYTPDGGVPCFFSGQSFSFPSNYATRGDLQSNGRLARRDTLLNTTRIAVVNGFVDISSAYASSSCGYSVSYKYVCLPYTNFSTITLVNNQSVPFSNVTARGGFAFFTLPTYATQLGLSLETYAVVYDYRGIKPPSFFLSRDYFPRLEFYDYTNTTYRKDFAQVFQFTLPNPESGYWYLGMYTYGTYSYFSIRLSWRYNVDIWQEDTAITGVTSSVKCGQFFVPVGRSLLVVEGARETPGGYPTIFIQQGLLPDQSNYDYVIDLQKADYQKVEISNPSRISPGINNPGIWFACAFKNTPIPEEGFVFKWSSYP